METNRPELSRSEWALMNLCWQLGKATARQIYEASLVLKQRDYRTVKTLLDRMAAKGWLKVEKLGPLCLFSPAVPRARAQGRAIREFLSNVMGDTLAPLFVHLSKDRRLSKEEAAELRHLLDTYEQETQKGDTK